MWGAGLRTQGKKETKGRKVLYTKDLKKKKAFLFLYLLYVIYVGGLITAE